MNDSAPAPQPPAGPPAGWYPDPSGRPGLRWWDGSRWTEHYQPPPPNPAVGGGDDSRAAASNTTPRALGPSAGPALAVQPLVPVGEWLSRSFRLSVREAGHFLPVVLLTLVPAYLALSVALWYGLRDVVMVSDRVRGTISFEGEMTTALGLAGLATAILILLFHLLYATACCHFRSVRIGGPSTVHTDPDADPEPAPWRSALLSGLLRWPPVSGTFLVRLALYWGTFALLSVMSAISPFFVLLFPLWPLVAVVAWVRYSLAGVVAAVGDDGRGRSTSASLGASVAATRFRFWSLLGRLLALTVVGASLFFLGNVVGGVFSAISGGQASGTIDPFGERIAFAQVLPTNPASFALNWLFLAFGAGAWQVLSAAGHSLLHADLDGSRLDDPVHH